MPGQKRFKSTDIAHAPLSPGNAAADKAVQRIHPAIEHATQRRKQLLQWMAELIAGYVSETAPPMKGQNHAQESL